MGADGSKPAPDGGNVAPPAVGDDDEPQGGMREDGGSIVAVHNNYDANKKASDDADLRAVLGLKEVGVACKRRWCTHLTLPCAVLLCSSSHSQW